MAKKDDTSQLPFETERRRFLPLLLSNPNYFGNLENSPLKPVKKIVSNTSYEELKCVGFNPELNRLEGVVWIKQPGGYLGGICTNGSVEYVSFFLSYDNGATWLPQGTTSFPVYDVPGPHPLEYAVSVVIHPPRKFCFVNNLPLVRAILSWNTPPSGPNAHPVWGNRLETRIQIDGFQILVDFPSVIDAAKLKLPPEFAGIVAEDATVKLQAPKALTAAELKHEYEKAKVEPHRFLQKSIQQATHNPATLAAASAYIGSLGVDLSAVIDALAGTNGNTDYEQLECIGLDEGTGSPDALVGTLAIKRPSGYLGGLCTAGSKEYVAFWIDWGSGWQWAGTPSVTVHDVSPIPKEGLSYAVYLPVNLNAHRKPCGEGPVTARVRAILSWDTPPSPFDPDFVPAWGNRLETRIFVNPGATTPIGDFTPYLTSICQVDVCSINQSSGWAYPGAGDHPFGGSVEIFGAIPGAPLFTPALTGMPKYQIAVQQIDTSTNTLLGSPQILTEQFGLAVVQQIGGGLVTSFPITQTAPGGFYTYQAPNPGPAGWRIVSPQGLLGVWNSSGKTGTWQISIVAWNDTLTTQYIAGTILCTLDGTTRQAVVIELDQLAPVPALAITGYKPGGAGPCIPAANCQTFTVGDVICGTYSVTDEHLGGFSLQAEPTPSPTAGFTVDGAAGNGLSYPNALLPLSGTKSGVWTYDTTGLPPCGYTIELFTSDRTIVSCGSPWQDNSHFVGFCLVAPAAKA